MSARFDPAKVCQKLRCKEMLIFVDHPEFPGNDADADLYGSHDGTCYWCQFTQTGRGPDGEPAHLADCALGTARSCFVSLDSIT